MMVGAKVRYTFNFKTGVKDFPAGTQLTLATDPSVAPEGLTCTIASPAHAISNSGTIAVADLVKTLIYTCHFDVLVTNAHRDLGEIGAFDVRFSFSGVTDAHYIPKVTAPAVPVYTGAFLTYESYLVDTSTLLRKWMSAGLPDLLPPDSLH